MTTRQLRLQLITEGAAGVVELNKQLGGLRSRLSGLTLPFIGGIGLSTLFGASLLQTAAQAGRAGQSWWMLSQRGYELQLALGSALHGAVEALSPALMGLIDIMTTGDGTTLSWTGRMALWGAAVVATAVSVGTLLSALRGLLPVLGLLRLAYIKLGLARIFALGPIGWILGGAAAAGLLAGGGWYAAQRISRDERNDARDGGFGVPRGAPAVASPYAVNRAAPVVNVTVNNTTDGDALNGIITTQVEREFDVGRR